MSFKEWSAKQKTQAGSPAAAAPKSAPADTPAPPQATKAPPDPKT